MKRIYSTSVGLLYTVIVLGFSACSLTSSEVFQDLYSPAPLSPNETGGSESPIPSLPVVPGEARVLEGLDSPIPAPTDGLLVEKIPYPPSQVITGVSFDWSSREQMASGSDNWPVTWAADGHQYTT